MGLLPEIHIENKFQCARHEKMQHKGLVMSVPIPGSSFTNPQTHQMWAESHDPR